MRVRSTPPAQLIDRRVQRFCAHARRSKRLARSCSGGQHQREQHALDGDEAVACLLCDLLGLIQHANGIVVQTGRLLRTAARYRRDFRQCRIGFAQGNPRIAACCLDKAGRHALLIFQQRLQQMLRADPLMVHADRHGLRRLQEAFGAVGEFFEVHMLTLS